MSEKNIYEVEKQIRKLNLELDRLWANEFRRRNRTRSFVEIDDEPIIEDMNKILARISEIINEEDA